ncbi:alpha/beta fold hydrolase [Rhodopila sp.]|uniref:alpha/beta fold hydrolase n=1 Tax=Rhodopila sp. TaxID=2480087 RepID=UPI002C935E4C|nr:alpha/beta hydrolase [Rhodopila sp.]HVZ09376.1 alpha/beta hydrolase [Rhodopila sp.]
MRLLVLAAASLLLSLMPALADRALADPARAQSQDRFFTSSDGVRLHYLEAGPRNAHTLVFIPGWTMPAWIWVAQIQSFSNFYHVIAFDPRGQGDSGVPATGYEPIRRGQDIAELLLALNGPPVVIVAWSLGVLDTLAAIHVAGDRSVAGLVLVDNSVGEEPPPTPRFVRQPPRRRGPPPSREVVMRQFVKGMFLQKQPDFFIDRLTEACLRTPDYAARLLLSYPVPRSYWREAIYATNAPVLYAVRPRWVAQGENLLRNRPNTELDVFTDAGHALFIDDAARFDRDVDSFLRRRVWP